MSVLTNKYKRCFSRAWVLLLLACLTSCWKSGELEDHQGREIFLKDWQDKTVLISYWATWCAPCKKEIPILNQLSQLAEQNQWEIIGVNFDELEQDELQQAIDEMGIEFPVLTQNPKHVLNLQPAQVVPVTYILKNGLKDQRVLLGPQSYEAFEKALRTDEKK